jgi:hypothetical protein
MMQQINLLRRAPRKPAFSWTSPRSMAWSVGLAIGISVALAAYEHYELYALTRQATRIDAAVKIATQTKDKASAANASSKPDAELEARVRSLEAQLRTRQEIVQALRRGLVGTTGGFSEYMRVFSRQAVQGLWLTGFDVAAGGDELTITGRTLNAELVPTYIQRLNREAAIQGRNFGSMLMKQALNRDELQTTAVKEAAAARSFLEFTLNSGERQAGSASGASEQRNMTPVSPRFMFDDTAKRGPENR